MKEKLIDSREILKNDLKKVGKILGDRLKSCRRKADLSQRQLAKRSGISQSRLCDIENGKKPISITDGKKLAMVLNVTPEFLIAGKE